MAVQPLGLALGLAFLAAGAVGRPLAARRGVDPSSWWTAVALTMVVTVVGARLAYGLVHWRFFIADPVALWRPPIEGLSYVGGLVAGLLFVAVLARRWGSSFGAAADLFALPYLTGMLIATLVGYSPVYGGGAGTETANWAVDSATGWVDSSANGWAVGALDAVYVTGIYLAIWWLGTRQRAGVAPLASFVGALTADAALRFTVLFLAGLVASTGWAGQWARLTFTGVMAFVGACFFLVLRRRTPLTLEPSRSWNAGVRRPVSRWAGWIAAYGLIVCLFVTSRVLWGLIG